MAYEAGFVNDGIPDFVKEAEEMMAKGETIPAPPAEVTIKFGKGLCTPFTSKSGKELMEVKIPNPDKSDHRPWEAFVVPASMIHENKFGKGVWMKLPGEGTTKLERPVRLEVISEGKERWGTETRTVSNRELKALMEAYKEQSRGSVLSDLFSRKSDSPSVKPAEKSAKKQESVR